MAPPKCGQEVASANPTTHRGKLVFKRYSPNYSLWPERARPGRRGIPLTLAAGGFAIGFVCATALYTVFTSFLGPAAVQQPPAQRDVQDSPSIAPEVAPGPAAVQQPPAQRDVHDGPSITPPEVAPAPKPVPAPPENTNHASRAPARAARVTLPIIGSQSAPPSAATDGRGGDPELAGGAPAAELAESSGSSASLMRQEGDPALEPRAPEALTEGSEPGAATERSAKPHKKTVRKTRERTRNYAAISRQKRERPTYAAARERQGSAHSTVTETASWY